MAFTYVPGKTYSFDTKAPSILSLHFKNAQLQGQVAYAIAKKTSSKSLDVLASQVLPSLPAGSPSDPRAYNWLIFQTESGSTEVIASLWIKEETITEVTTKITYIEVQDANYAIDGQRLRELIVAAGYNKVTISGN